MLKKAFKLQRDYEDAKKAAVEHVINNFESRTSLVLVTILFLFIVLLWIYAIFTSLGFEKISEKFGNAPLALPFLFSYFFFFVGSKLIFKQTEEEVNDDTSMFALFSACERRERRSFYSILLSLGHTVIFILYLLNRDFSLN